MRARQVIGDLIVLPDLGKWTRKGAILWPVLNTTTNRVKFTRTYVVVRMAREHNSPMPSQLSISDAYQ